MCPAFQTPFLQHCFSPNFESFVVKKIQHFLTCYVGGHCYIVIFTMYHQLQRWLVVHFDLLRIVKLLEKITNGV